MGIPLLTSECHGQHQNKSLWLCIISRKMSSTAMSRATAATTAEIFSNKMKANQENSGASNQTQVHQFSHQVQIHQSSNQIQIHQGSSNQIPNPILTAEIASKGVETSASC